MKTSFELAKQRNYQPIWASRNTDHISKTTVKETVITNRKRDNFILNTEFWGTIFSLFHTLINYQRFSTALRWSEGNIPQAIIKEPGVLIGTIGVVVGIAALTKTARRVIRRGN